MGRRADTPHTAAGREIWKALEKLEHRGHSRDRIFRDWLDLILSAYLSTTAHMQAGKLDISKPGTFFERDNKHEAEYLTIAQHYADDQPNGNRCIDFLTLATAHLINGIELEDGDPLGDVYMAAISFGEHGQFFTPLDVAEMMAKMTMDEIKNGQTVCDSSCGSGVTLIAAAKQNPLARFLGIDLDERCAKMAAINLMLRDLTGTIYCGNALTGEMYTRWDVRNGWITRDDKPGEIRPIPQIAANDPKDDHPLQLVLL